MSGVSTDVVRERDCPSVGSSFSSSSDDDDDDEDLSTNNRSILALLGQRSTIPTPTANVKGEFIECITSGLQAVFIHIYDSNKRVYTTVSNSLFDPSFNGNGNNEDDNDDDSNIHDNNDTLGK